MAILLPIFLFSFSAPQRENDSQTKALFIYSFAKYIHWPQEEMFDDFTVGVFGRTDVAKELKIICENKKVKDAPINIISINTPEDIGRCQAVFVAKNQNALLPDLLGFIGTKSILVITEGKGMLKQGAAITFVNSENKLGFELNLTVLQHQDLKIPRDLLMLAANANSATNITSDKSY